jgi:hypothetical protein
MTPSGIEPATFRFVAQYLNHCATISDPRFSRHISIKVRNIKFHGIPTSRCRADRQTDGRTDTTEILRALFATMLKRLNSLDTFFLSLQHIPNVFCEVGAGYLNII